jgi:delta14-sterol reductase
MDIVHSVIGAFKTPTWTSVVIYSVWLVWLFILSHIVPGPIARGQPIKTRDGKTIQLEYRMNGFYIFLISLLVYFLLIYLNVISPTIVANNYGALISLVLIFSFLVSVYLYISAHVFDRVEKGHITGNLLKDFWLGVELNPSFGGLDLKMFALRPGMMGWTMINLSVASLQYSKYGFLSNAMILQFILAFIYVADYFFFEERMLSTWDIIAEHWGFMLVYADLWFIPVMFSIQSWYLVGQLEPLSSGYILLTIIIFSIGYYIFRISNLEKDQFKTNADKKIWGKKPRMIGDKLIADGWWGRVQHPNYLGDILISISFSLPCTTQLGGYFYPIYLIILLIHRQIRDDKKCSEKYGKLWNEYCKAVPYRLIPYIY